jgi:hypothetical protein
MTDNVIGRAFRNASIDGGEMTLWVMSDRCSCSGLPAHVRFTPKATKLQEGSKPTLCAKNDILHRRKAASLFAVGPP